MKFPDVVLQEGQCSHDRADIDDLQGTWATAN
jgi:hypothetical protein